MVTSYPAVDLMTWAPVVTRCIFKAGQRIAFEMAFHKSSPMRMDINNLSFLSLRSAIDKKVVSFLSTGNHLQSPVGVKPVYHWPKSQLAFPKQCVWGAARVEVEIPAGLSTPFSQAITLGTHSPKHADIKLLTARTDFSLRGSIVVIAGHLKSSIVPRTSPLVW